jgi:hypothetical protein
MPRPDLPPLNFSQQLVWKALSLVEEDELVGMLRALRHHPDRNLTIDRINEALDQGLDLIAMFSDDYKGFRDLYNEGVLELDVELGTKGLVFLIIGFSGGLGEVAEFRFTLDADGLIAQVDFLESHNDFLLKGFFDKTLSFS